jgi:selenide,water dikinase
LLFGEPLVDWTPQDEFLGLIGTGFGHAIASKGGMALEGSFLWELKDKIDRTWMRPYQQLPTMAEMAEKRKLAPPVPEAERKELEALGQPEVRALLQKSQMRCAGCGSKVGASVITRAFQRLQLLEKTARQPFPTSRAEIVAGIGKSCPPLSFLVPRP